jgi:hypothetical protein
LKDGRKLAKAMQGRERDFDCKIAQRVQDDSSRANECVVGSKRKVLVGEVVEMEWVGRG